MHIEKHPRNHVTIHISKDSLEDTIRVDEFNESKLHIFCMIAFIKPTVYDLL